MIKHLMSVGQDELREELSLLVSLNRAIVNFSHIHGPGLQAKFPKTFFLDQAFCNQIGFKREDDRMILGLPSQEFDLDVFGAFSRAQLFSGFVVTPYEYLFLPMRAGNHETRQSNLVALALPFPRTLLAELAELGRLTVAKMDKKNRYSGEGTLTNTSFDIEVRRDKTLFWENM